MTKKERICNWEDSHFNKLCWENWTVFYKRMKLDHYFIFYTKRNSKGIKDLNVRPETIKFLEENIEDKLLDIGLGDDFLNLTPKAKATKAKINKWDDIKLKSPCRGKVTIIRIKRQPTEWDKVFANQIPEKRLISKVYKELT